LFGLADCDATSFRLRTSQPWLASQSVLIFNGDMKKFALLALSLFVAFNLPAQDQTPAEQLGWKLAVHSYTFRKFSIFDAIDKTAAMGIKYMSISGSVNLLKDGKIKTIRTPDISDSDFAAIQAHMREKGISPNFVNMGVVIPTTNEVQSRKLFEAAKRLGIDMLVAEPETHGHMEELKPVMDVVEKLAKEYNIKVAIHNHPGPKDFYWNPDTVLAAIKGRSPLLGACADVGQWVRSGLNPVECLKKLQGHVLVLHFKDLNQMGLKAHDVPWGTGISNVKGMMEELKRQHFHGAFCVEYEYHWDTSAPEIAQSAKYFNDICAELVKGN
jgi:sugar phosphate isomerase/epimerase